MSFVPAPQQANAARSNASAPNNVGGQVTSSNAAAPGDGAAAPEISDQELLFKLRTFDVYWVDKHALMYRDGIAKVSRTSCRAREETSAPVSENFGLS